MKQLLFLTCISLFSASAHAWGLNTLFDSLSHKSPEELVEIATTARTAAYNDIDGNGRIQAITYITDEATLDKVLRHHLTCDVHSDDSQKACIEVIFAIIQKKKTLSVFDEMVGPLSVGFTYSGPKQDIGDVLSGGYYHSMFERKVFFTIADKAAATMATYSKNFEYSQWDYPKDYQRAKQIIYSMSKLPHYYRQSRYKAQQLCDQYDIHTFEDVAVHHRQTVTPPSEGLNKSVQRDQTAMASPQTQAVETTTATDDVRPEVRTLLNKWSSPTDEEKARLHSFSQEELKLLVSSAKSNTIQLEALNLLTDPKALAAIVKEAPERHRSVALSKITDENTLLGLIQDPEVDEALKADLLKNGALTETSFLFIAADGAVEVNSRHYALLQIAEAYSAHRVNFILQTLQQYKADTETNESFFEKIAADARLPKSIQTIALKSAPTLMIKDGVPTEMGMKLLQDPTVSSATQSLILEKIIDEATLETLVITCPSEWFTCNMLTKIKNPQIILEVGLKTEDADVAKSVIECLPTNAPAAIALNNPNPDIAVMALAQIQDAATVVDIARQNTKEHLTLAALSHPLFNDDALCIEFAKNGSEPIAMAAINRIADERTLTTIAIQSQYNAVAEQAIRKLTTPLALFHVAVESQQAERVHSAKTMLQMLDFGWNQFVNFFDGDFNKIRTVINQPDIPSSVKEIEAVHLTQKEKDHE